MTLPCAYNKKPNERNLRDRHRSVMLKSLFPLPNTQHIHICFRIQNTLHPSGHMCLVLNETPDLAAPQLRIDAV